MKITRSRAVAMFGAALVLPQCSGRVSENTVRIGSKNFTEEFIVAELYALALENAGLRVERKFNLGATQIAMAALRRGDIDLYPEYTGTGLIDVLHHAPLRDANAVFDLVRNEFQKQFGLTWLTPSPMNDSQGLATTHAVSAKYNLHTLSQLSKLAPQLRLGAVPEFLSRADALPGLQKFYGGFQFKDVKTYDIGLKYQALVNGQADVVTAFTTDALIGADHLVVLDDDRHFWPEYHVAPVVRNDTLKKFPQIQGALDKVSTLITNPAILLMNAAVDVEKQEAPDVAAAFFKAHFR